MDNEKMSSLLHLDVDHTCRYQARKSCTPSSSMFLSPQSFKKWGGVFGIFYMLIQGRRGRGIIKMASGAIFFISIT
jgi:hypothetical protein